MRDLSKYRNPAPYPTIKVLKPNLQYAELLMDDNAGVVSEFTAIAQYLYHHYYFDEIDKELGTMLEDISIVEMYHMDLLSKTIILLGGDPQIRGSYSTQGQYWDGEFVYYGTELCQRLQKDLESEYQAIDQYRAHIRLIDDMCVKELLERIILDEQVHIKLFEKALQKYCKNFM